MQPLLRLNIIGCGRLGTTLTYLLHQVQQCVVQDIYNVTQTSGQKAVDFIGAGRSIAALGEMRPADIYLITTPDDSIESTCRELMVLHQVPVKSMVLHACGSLSSAILQAAKGQGCLIGSIHPLTSFVDPKLNIHTVTGSYCSFEGDAEILPHIEKLLTAIGFKLISIDPEQKSRYHAATVFAANFLVLLSDIAEKNLLKSGIALEDAHAITLDIMQSVLNNRKKLSAKAALSGPAARGDTQVITRHIEALQADPVDLELYQLLTQRLLNLTSHDAATKQLIIDYLKLN